MGKFDWECELRLLTKNRASQLAIQVIKNDHERRRSLTTKLREIEQQNSHGTQKQNKETQAS